MGQKGTREDRGRQGHRSRWGLMGKWGQTADGGRWGQIAADGDTGANRQVAGGDRWGHGPMGASRGRQVHEVEDRKSVV